jgi:hypothetical protein
MDPCLAQEDLHVALPAQDVADRRGDIARRQPGRRHLVQEGLEDVVVLLVDQDHVDAGAAQRTGGPQTAETPAEHDDPRPPGGPQGHMRTDAGRLACHVVLRPARPGMRGTRCM